MTLALRPATTADVPAMVDVFFTAFAQDPIAQLVFPRTEIIRKWWHSNLLEELSEPAANLIVAYSTSDSGQTPIAFAKWKSSAAEIDSQMHPWPKGADAAIGDHFFGELHKKHREIMAARKHWYLELLVTRPEWQGKGAGGKLVKWGTDMADEDGLEAYVESSPPGVALYTHAGFREMHRLSFSLKGKEEVVGKDVKEYVEVFMLRPIKKNE